MNVVLALLVVVAQAAPAAPAAKVRLVEASAEPVTRRVAGNVVAAERATISTRVAATVARVNAAEGDRVRRGTVLVRLAAQDLRGQLEGALAARDAARAHEKRIASLLAERAATPAEMDQARAQRAGADAAVAAAQANLGYAEIRAPFDGVVQAKRVQPGDLVGPGQPLLELEGLRGLEIHASLSEDEGRGVRRGLRLAYEADGARGTAEVIAMAPGGDPGSHRVAIRARVVEPAAGLRSGAFVRLALPSTAGAVVSVPRSALVERGDLSGVFVVEGGRARLRWLAVGDASGDRVEIRAGIRQGEKVVAEPGALADGAAVEVSDGR